MVPNPGEAGSKAAERSHSGLSAVLRHADNSGRRASKTSSRSRVFTKEDEAYHTQASNLNAFRHMKAGIRATQHRHAMLFPVMKLVIGLVLLVLILASFYADYKWKQWVAARKQERDHPPNSFDQNPPS
jgi:hypothetical protein